MALNEGPPNWMRERALEDTSPKGSPRQTKSYIKSDLSQHRNQWNTTPSLEPAVEMPKVHFPDSVVTGVKIIAGLMLLNTWFAFSFGVFSLIEPAGTELRDTFSGNTYSVVTFNDYFNFWRVALSGALAVGLSILTWKVVDDS